MSTILGNGISIRGGNSRAGARISTTLNDDGTQNVFIEDNVNTIIDIAKSIFSVSYNKVLVPLVGGSTPSGKLEFTYTGEYNERLEDGVVELLTSGTLVFKSEAAIDAFLVGGGSGGAGGVQTTNGGNGGGGGAGGYTKTILNITPRINTDYTIIIGDGSAGAQYAIPAEPGGSTTAFGTTVEGGAAQSASQFGAPGGSGGGGSGSNSSYSGYYNGASGGSDGANGTAGGGGNSGGTGQGTTTREFGEATGKLYAGGGGGGAARYPSGYSYATGSGGSGVDGGGNGASASANAGSAIANTGSGGGGGACGASGNAYVIGGNGGSGIVCIRLHKGDEPSSDIPLSGDLAVGNLVTFDDKSWRVVHNDGTKWYLASENIIENTVFGNGTVNYYQSTLASKCTSYLSNFSELAQKYMIDVTVKLAKDVTAKVFIPTREQILSEFTYYNTNANRIATLNGTASIWWLSGSTSQDIITYVCRVLASGSTDYGAYQSSFSYGFRPHICIDTSP